MTEQQDDEATVVRPRAPRVPAPPLEADAEDTIVRLVEPAAPVRATLAPPSSPAAAPGVPAEVAAEVAAEDAAERDAATPATWAVRVRGTAAVVPLDRPVIVGRRPGAARVGEHPEPRRLVLPADRADVSGRHARLEQLGETLVVADLGSTNGTVVHWSSGAPRRLRPGESCAVLPDALVELGDGVVIEFVLAPDHSRTDPLTSEPPS
ncbi:MAG: FHA domain-containing protein [Microcella sp.]